MDLMSIAVAMSVFGPDKSVFVVIHLPNYSDSFTNGNPSHHFMVYIPTGCSPDLRFLKHDDQSSRASSIPRTHPLDQYGYPA